MKGVTNYIVLCLFLLAIGFFLTVYVHPAGSVFLLALLALLFGAAGSLWHDRRHKSASASEQNTENSPSDDPQDQRICIPVRFENTTINLYFDGNGKILHVLDPSGQKDLGSMGFVVARLWESNPALMLDHINRRIALVGPGATLAFFISDARPGEKIASGTIGTITANMEEKRFVSFICQCALSLAAATVNHGWSHEHDPRDFVARFLLDEAENENSLEIENIMSRADGPATFMREFSRKSPEQQSVLYSQAEVGALIALLRVVPADLAWDCLRPLAAKIRLMLAEDLYNSPFPSEKEWRDALQTVRAAL